MNLKSDAARGRWIRKNPREAFWLREMMVQKELGYIPEDYEKFEFVCGILQNKMQKKEKKNKYNKLKGLIQKNK